MTFGAEAEEKKSPFRQAALARLNNPEQLDRLLTVTTARSWIAFVVALLLVATAVGWSIFGNLSTYVRGSGLFMFEGGHILSAVAPGPGTLTDVLVTRGQDVEKGQVVARLVSPDSEVQIANARALMAERQTELERLRTVSAAEIQDRTAAFARRREALTTQHAAAEARADALQLKLGDEQHLLRRQIITRSTMMQTQAQLDAALNEVADTTAQLANVDSQEAEAVFQVDQRIKTGEFSLADAQRRLFELMEANRTGTEVLAPDAGRIDAIQVNAGTLVNRGQSIVTIETPGALVEFVMFVPVRDGGDNLEAGEKVNVSPNWTTREEQGTMLGQIREVSKFPVTLEEIRALVQNEELVRSFSSAGPTYVAHVKLDRDPMTVSGYAWTSERGALEPITSGGFGTADVLVAQEKPIGLVIPTLRRWTGV